MTVRKTRPEEYRRVNELFALCFEQPYQNCPIDPEHDDAIHWAAHDEDGAMMSTFTIGAYPIQFDGNVCPMGGVGGVATLPQYRRRGGIRACFQKALPDLYAQGFDFSYLYPFSTAYYRKFGYECCAQKFYWNVNLSLLNPPKGEGTFRLMEKGNPMTEAVRALDEGWEAKYNLAVRHGERDYAWTREADPAVKQEFTYVCFDSADAPRAYTSFRVAMESDGRNILCSRFRFDGREGFRLLMGLFQSLASDHTYAKFLTPAERAIQYYLPEWSMGAVRWDLRASSGMVRVVNVKSVLEKAAYRGSGRVALQIRDPQIPENNETFAVTFHNGRAMTVLPTAAEPEAVLDIAAFSALISGVCDFDGAREAFPGLEVRKDTFVLEQVFYQKPIAIEDYF